MNLELVSPAIHYRDTVIRGLRELQAEGLPWWVAMDLQVVEEDFAAFVAEKLADAHRRTESFVPATVLWAIADGQFVGRISIRTELNDALRVMGGHVGYDTVPSFRGRGVATAMLRRALPRLHALGLTEVRLTVDDTNAASIRVIERNGGVLRETKSLSPDRPAKRYYDIALPPNLE